MEVQAKGYLEDILKVVADVSKTLDTPKYSDKLEDFEKIIPRLKRLDWGNIDITVDFSNILLVKGLN